MAHATNPEAVKDAVRLGAHSVEHGYIMDDECIDALLEHDTWYVPTLAITPPDAGPGPRPVGEALGGAAQPRPAISAGARTPPPSRTARFRQALDAGVRMALGSDIRPLKDAALLELGLWVPRAPRRGRRCWPPRATRPSSAASATNSAPSSSASSRT